MSEQKEFYMEDQTGRKFISVHFDSILDLLDYQTPWNKSVWDEHVVGGTNNGSFEWLGPTNPTSHEVVEHALKGDHELYNEWLKPMISKLREATGRHRRDYQQMITRTRRVPTWNGFGDELDIHRVYQGQLDKAWRRTIREEAAHETKLVTLFIQTGGLGMESAKASLWRAAVAILLMEDLVNAGKSVKLVAGAYSDGVTVKGHGVCTSINIKNYNESLSVERLAAMSHLGFFRTFCFGARACQPYETSFGLGHSRNMRDQDMPLQFHQDLATGHAKFVLLDRCMSLKQAIESINKAADKMKEFSNEAKQA